jgi:predicted PurR-regulated permease PerM
MDIDVYEVVQRLERVVKAISASLQGAPVLQRFLEPLLVAASQGLSSLTAAQTAETVPQVSLAQVGSYFGRALGTLSDMLGPSVGALATVLFTFLLSLQMALTSDTVWNWFADLIPPAHGPEFDRILKEIQRIWTGFLRGQMLLMLVVGMVTWLGGLALGLPQALLLGILAGVFELIPNIGPVLAAIPAVIIALLFGSTYLGVGNLVFALIVVAFYVLVQLFENQLLVPRIMGDAVDLPPLIVLVGTIAGAGAYGILGALLATPVIATGNLLFRYVYRKIMEQPPPPQPVEQPSIMDSIRGYLARWQKSPRP